jgi:hypothetical protein
MIWSHNHFCGPCEPTQLCPSPILSHCWGNNWSKESFWGICKVTWCDSQILPCRQWLLYRKPLPECGCQIGIDNLFLRSQCSFPKWHSGETDSQPLGTSKETTPTCKSKMAISNQNQSMAICTLQCKWHSEHNCRQRRWELISRKVLSNRSPPEVKT